MSHESHEPAGQSMNDMLTRRHFLGRSAMGLGAAALAQLFDQDLGAVDSPIGSTALPGLPHFPPTAKRVIFLFQGGGPSQIDMFDFKPRLREWNGTDLPDSIRNGQRLTAMTAAQTRFPVAPSIFSFAQHGRSGAWVSELMPHTANIVD